MTALRARPPFVRRVRGLSAPRPAPDPDALERESPAHPVTLRRFFIARYPVTVAQWRVYYDASEEARKTLQPWSKEGMANHPVVGVSWHDALGYCRWLTRQLRDSARTPEPLATLLREGDGKSRHRWIVTLPSEAEWEKAARGYDGRRYPWDHDGFDANLASGLETWIDATSAVGCFPGGRSPAHTEDQSGSVLEWTRSRWGDRREPRYPYTYRPDYKGAERENLVAPDGELRVVRGGSFNTEAWNLRSAFRSFSYPWIRRYDLGFRVVASPFADPFDSAPR